MVMKKAWAYTQQCTSQAFQLILVSKRAFLKDRINL